MNLLNKCLGAALLTLIGASFFTCPPPDGVIKAGFQLSCPRPPQGPPGPPGPGIEAAFASAYTNTIATESAQEIGVTPVFIIFDTNQFPPVLITHPVGLDDTQFQVQEAGFYYISFTTTANFTGDTGVEGGSLTFFVNGAPVQPDPFAVFTVGLDAFAQNVSGSTLLFLNAGDIVQLSATAEEDAMIVINNPTFNIFRVAL